MYACKNCGGALRFNIASQQLKCDQCSSEFDPYSVTKETDAETDTYYEATVFKCPQCGGEILSSDNSAANFCSFCGASTILTQNMRREKKPGYIIPFSKSKEDCKKAYAKFVRHSWFAPKELKDAKYIDGFRGIYMPYWAYHITEQGPITLCGSNSHRRGDYIITDHYTLSGDINSSYKGISYDASSSFDDSLSASIAPYDVKGMNTFTPSYLCGFYADTADVDPKVYEPDAKHLAASQTYNYIKSHPDTHKFKLDDSESTIESKLNPRCERVDGAMFPVWFLSYRNRDRVAYATVNGQTGKVVADMPVSVGKYLISSLVLAIPIFILLNAMFTLIPAISLGVSSVLASIVPFLFIAELKQIIRRDESDFEDVGSAYRNAQAGNSSYQNGSAQGKESYTYKAKNPNSASDDSAKKAKTKRRRKTSGGGIMTTIAVIYAIAMFVMMTDTSVAFLATCVSLILGIIGFLCSLKPHKSVNGQGISSIALTLITLVIATGIELIEPVSDFWYYGGIIANLLAVLAVLIGLIQNYNILATRRLPQFDNYRGGDDRA